METQGSRDSRSVWNNTSRVNHRNFSSDFRHPHQRRSFIPSAVLTREGLKSTVRSKMSQAVPSQMLGHNPEEELKDHAIINSGCSGSMTGDKDKLSYFKEYKGGYVAFGNDLKGGRITGKGTIKTS
ncbi:hypothetical protein Tco_0791157 [Tanacetum coccineum]